MIEFFNFSLEHLPALLNGARVTIILWLICIAGGTVLGLLLALSRVYGGKILYGIATAYVEFFRGTPLLVQMFIIYLGLPGLGVTLKSFEAAVLAIGLNTAAYQAEYFRGAIQSVEAGQMQAARSMGMGKLKGMFYIVVPQAARIVIPQWSNEVILELKSTSLAFAIGVADLMSKAKAIGFTTFRYFEIFLLAAIIYLVIVMIVSSSLDLLSDAVRVPGLGHSKKGERIA